MSEITIDGTLKLINELGDKLAAQAKKLREWETAFETTNVAQAKAEHDAVLQKRRDLQDEVIRLNAWVKELTATVERLQPKPEIVTPATD